MVDLITPVYSMQAVPIMALPIDPQPTPTVPTVVSKLTVPTSNNIAITPLFLLTHYFLHIYDPKNLSLERGHHRSWEGNVLYQGRRMG